MCDSLREQTTNLLARLVDGDVNVAEELFPLAYDELRQLARNVLRGDRAEQSLQATALVNEAYLKLVDFHRLDWRGRARFGAIAARAMRSVLVDHLRRKASDKRGANWQRVTMQGLVEPGAMTNLDVLELDEALGRFEVQHERHARAVELRYFGGLSRAEIAEVLQVSERTVTADLAFAQAWLRREMDAT